MRFFKMKYTGLMLMYMLLFQSDIMSQDKIYEEIEILTEEWRRAGLVSSFDELHRDKVIVRDTLFRSEYPEENNKNMDRLTASLKDRDSDVISIIQFESGLYLFESGINISPEMKNVIFRGAEEAGTTLVYAGEGKSESLFSLTGEVLNTYRVDSLSGETNSIYLNHDKHAVRKGDMISAGPDPKLKNDSDTLSYNNYNKPMNNLYYQARVVRADGNVVTADRDLSIFSDQLPLDSLTADRLIVRRIDPVENVGFKNLTLKTWVDWNIDSSRGNHINIRGATNIRIDNVTSYKPIQQHVRIWESSHIAVRDSYFHEAYSYGREGGNGSGYGVSVGRSNHCLIENNRFRKLRHSISMASGSAFNVAGYNYSHDQYSDKFDNGNIVQTRLSDINLHGIYPYANLIESNYCDEIKADQWHSRNGPFNTFLRNKTKRDRLTLENANYSILIGNESNIKLKETSEYLKRYYDPLPLEDRGINIAEVLVNTLKTYYYTEKPSHIYSGEEVKQNLPWPSIGPPVSPRRHLPQTIPAKQNAPVLEAEDSFKYLIEGGG